MKATPVPGREVNLRAQDSEQRLCVDLSRVLVVGRSNINRVVVSKIVERSGLKPISEAPEDAARTLKSMFPGTVIMDGGADNRDCDCLIAGLVSLRSVSHNEVPSVILLTTQKLNPNELARLTAVDAVVTKPITTEMLQPVVDRLIERARG